MSKKTVKKSLLIILLVLMTLFTVKGALSDSLYPIYVGPLISGGYQPNKVFEYKFDFCQDSACSTVLQTFTENITTDSRGIGFINLTLTEFTEVPVVLRESRDGSVRLSHLFGIGVYNIILANQIGNSNARVKAIYTENFSTNGSFSASVPASNITNGTFSPGDYTFPGNITIDKKITFTLGLIELIGNWFNFDKGINAPEGNFTNVTTTTLNVTGTSTTRDIIPSENNTHSLGSEDKVWKEIYVSGDGSLHVGGVDLSEDGNTLTVGDKEINASVYHGDGGLLTNITAILSTLANLTQYINNSNLIGTGIPDYDSGWINISLSETKTFTHNLNSYDLDVDVMARDIVAVGGATYGHWKLNSLAGIYAMDSSANGRTGTLVNMENEDWVTGKLNNALVFDGVNEYIDFNGIANFERDEEFSIEFWFNTSNSGDNNVIISKSEEASGKGWHIKTHDSGKLYVVLANDPTTGNSIINMGTDNSSFDDGVYHHCIVTYDGSSDASGVTIYVDNVDQGVTVVQNTLDATIQNTAHLQVSGREGQNRLFTGNIDEVVIYEEELDSSDVSLRWNNGAGRESIPGEELEYIIHNKHWGCTVDGFFISLLNDTVIKVSRGISDLNADQVRARIWKYG